MARLYELLVSTCLNLFRRVWTRIILVDLYMKEDMGKYHEHHDQNGFKMLVGR